MEVGSIGEVTERLKLWCLRPDSGMARVEWDSDLAQLLKIRKLLILQIAQVARFQGFAVLSDKIPHRP